MGTLQDDLMYLNHLVVNTINPGARRTGTSRPSMSLPRPKSSGLLESEGSCYESLCEQQPIGRRLFRQFLLDSNSRYAAAAKLLEEFDHWQYMDGEAKEEAKLSVLARFRQPESRSFLFSHTGDAAEKYASLPTVDEAALEHVREATRTFLKGAPFSEYLKSPFFYRFLQWKEYEKQKITRKYFYEFRTLGRGGFGEVCAVQVKHTGQMYACKKLDKRRLKKKGGERLALIEKQILEKTNSRFVINLAYAYDDRTHLCLVMDLMSGGDLKFHIYDLGKRGLRMERVVYYAAQITSGILHLHSMDIVYRDMKPENVLLDAKGQCRLSDFGLAVELPKGGPDAALEGQTPASSLSYQAAKWIPDESVIYLVGQKSRLDCGPRGPGLDPSGLRQAGTTGYMAPEILRQENYSLSVDWWSAGCSIYEMVAARLPFKDFKEKVQNEEVTRRTLEDECKFQHSNFDAPVKDLISHFLKKKVQNRLGCRSGDDPRNHVFFKGINFHRLEAGLTEPPWVPKPNVVYAKITDASRTASEDEDVKLDSKDERFFEEFSTGAVPVRWQKEMLESGTFDLLNRSELDASCQESVCFSSMCVII